MNFLQQVYKGKTDWWRGLIILVFSLPPFLIKYIKGIVSDVFSPLLPKTNNMGLVLTFSPYIFLLIIFTFLFGILHKRPVLTLITSRKKFDWVRLLFSFSTWGVLAIFMMIISVYMDAENYIWNFKIGSFIQLLAVCLTLMTVQIFFSEVLIRAYSLQFFSYLFKKPWVALLITVSVATYLMHLTNKNLLNLVGSFIIIYYIITNLLLGFIVILDDGLEITLGMRMANNLVYLLFVNSRVYSFQRDAVLVNNEGSSVFTVVYCSLLFYPLYFYFLARVYKWGNWKQKFLNKVEKV